MLKVGDLLYNVTFLTNKPDVSTANVMEELPDLRFLIQENEGRSSFTVELLKIEESFLEPKANSFHVSHHLYEAHDKSLTLEQIIEAFKTEES